jgi:transketolase
MVASEQTVVTGQQLDALCINTIRTLAMDAVQQANSGHPGAPMGLAPVAYALWQEFLRYDPENPVWPNRDRFVLSAGHASMLLYATLYLTGVRAVNKNGEVTRDLSVSLEQIKRFRQLDSRTPGHPESHITTGVETTTGPLGQGAGNSVGMAIAERWLAANYNRPGFEVFNYNVYAICGDGDLMEGVAAEAASLAGHLRLSNLCWIYDNNKVTLDGPAWWSFSEDVMTRFVGYGWNVTRVSDANDLAMLARAFHTFLEQRDKPTLIVVDSHIGYGSPHKQDSSEAHGEPLGEDEVRLTKKNYGWPEDAKFLVPEGVLEHFREGIGRRGRELRTQWEKKYADYSKQFPELAAQLDLMQRRKLPEGWDRNLPSFPADAKGIATRESGGKVLNALAQNIPWLVGGSADLGNSNKTNLKFEGAGNFSSSSYGGRNLHFGVREHAMGAALNGMSVSRLLPFGGTFFNFSDYLRPTIRLAALMETPVIYVYTHDSIGLGEDGPTHQPVEHLTALRAIPNMSLWRPCDAAETAIAWTAAIERRGPTAVILTRQPVPQQARTPQQVADIRRGGYTLIDCSGTPECIVIATGSEIGIAAEAVRNLNSGGRRIRLVSMPSAEAFDAQDEAYRQSVLPPAVRRRLAVEAGATLFWWRYVGTAGRVLGIDRFGASGKFADVYPHFGFSAANIALQVRELLDTN